MSDDIERAEQHIRLAESTSNAEWATAHAVAALALIVREFVNGRS